MTNQFKIGQSAMLSKIFTSADVIEFSKLSLDTNPIHLDIEHARNTIFKKPIVHGYLSGSLISAVIANHLPGPGSIYLNQVMNFKSPVYHGEEISAVVTIRDIKHEKSIIYLDTNCYNKNQDLVIEGTAVIKIIKL